MKLPWKYIVVASLLINCFFISLLFEAENIDRTPPWHPFELNSELTLESIVQNGYRFSSFPCGQVQYSKEIGDTYIQYEVEVDCKSYDGHYDYEYLELVDESDSSLVIVDLELDESELYKDTDSIESELNREQDYKNWQEEITNNQYYPWDLNEIKDCYQKISWRYFARSLGSEIDSLGLIEYIESNDGYVITSTNDWNTTLGGSFMVRYDKTELYFRCFIGKESNAETEEPQWSLDITSRIPQLNQKAINEQQDRRAKIQEYYKE